MKFQSVIKKFPTTPPALTAAATSEKQNSNKQTIRAELIGSNISPADGIRACGFAPVLSLCRKLVAAGYGTATPLEAWRDTTLVLRVRSIGEAANLVINSKGTDFVRRPTVRTGPSVAQNHPTLGEAAPDYAEPLEAEL